MYVDFLSPNLHFTFINVAPVSNMVCFGGLLVFCIISPPCWMTGSQIDNGWVPTNTEWFTQRWYQSAWSWQATRHPKSRSTVYLTYFLLDKMAAISQTIFSDAFSWIQSFIFWLIFHGSVFLCIQLTMTQQWFTQWHGAVGDKPLSEPMLTRFIDAYMRLWERWVENNQFVQYICVCTQCTRSKTLYIKNTNPWNNETKLVANHAPEK